MERKCELIRGLVIETLISLNALAIDVITAHNARTQLTLSSGLESAQIASYPLSGNHKARIDARIS